ncbi:MAG: DUF4270 family protein [Bacteroidales bacterium]|nr:DUF4270 family protein [Bacteroidales bacterium]
MKTHFPILSAALLAVVLLAGCTDKETSFGAELQDPSTRYSGTHSSATCSNALMLRDDTLLTVGYSLGLLGRYEDPVLGTTQADIYTQVTFPYADNIRIDSQTSVDSVILTLAVSHFQPGPGNSASAYTLQITVTQLAEAPLTDSSYYDHSTLPLSSVKFFDGTTTFTPGSDSVIRLPLNAAFAQLLEGHTYTSESWLDAVKGIHISMDNNAVATVNFAAAGTCITAYLSSDTNHSEATFNIGARATHFNHFDNQFAGPLAPFAAGADSIAGASTLYLTPMAGSNLMISFDTFVSSFHAAHPHAVIHYAELLLPLAAGTDTSLLPDKVIAFKRTADGNLSYIPDMTDAHRASGFDGTYDSRRNCYRLRITQHLQKLLLQGNDYGTLLALNSRRSSTARLAVDNTPGTQPMRIEFIYTE